MQAQISNKWSRRLATLALLSLAISPIWRAEAGDDGPGAVAAKGASLDVGGQPEKKTEGKAVSRAFRRLVTPFARGHEKKTAPAPAASGEVSRPQGVSQVREDYLIGPEDVLGIQVWQEPQISRVVPVRPDGKISLALIGEVNAAGMTPLKLQSAITAALKNYLANPEVTVIVEKVNSQKFNVLGEVVRPGSYDLAKRVNVLDAIAVAGGFREFAKVKDVYVLRRMSDGSTTRLPFNYKDFMKGKNSDQNVDLQSGDTVVVP